MTSSRPTPERRQLANLGPLQQLRAGRMTRRLVQLVVGLAIYGMSMALVIRGALGVIPWDVLHTGLIQHIPVSFGQMTILVSLTVLLMWVPLRQMPGLGTVANAFLVGIAADITLALVPPVEDLAVRGVLLVGGITLNGMATAMYIGSQLGPGPRDGLMTGLSRVSGRSIRLVRTAMEVTVVALGWALGGAVGLGTVLYAVAIGPLAQLMLPWFTVDLRLPAPESDDIPSAL
ncbi:membrane protein YczE [Ornithinimicrobium sediminis]|uniref:membrane protein YczE n=1 Tax=Ornithinimicrobium sediminis TaxID=2904603 RepID=UPI001E3DABBE|nr:hypothetical protein [Ornithinimicrobium sediminis]MCE0487106.1 hypothetical protein [Ornithinimicrobium sediminis]